MSRAGACGTALINKNDDADEDADDDDDEEEEEEEEEGDNPCHRDRESAYDYGDIGDSLSPQKLFCFSRCEPSRCAGKERVFSSSPAINIIVLIFIVIIIFIIIIVVVVVVIPKNMMMLEL